jgi:23S rRNA pseudouridine1911/1915/1917 synthase
MEPVIIYEDTDVLVINKPAGIRVHNDLHGSGETVVEWFLRQVPEARGVGESMALSDGTPVERSGVVHRLDRDTSGILVLAKHQAAHSHLKRQFHNRLVHKEYRAFVYGIMREKWGTIDRPIGRSAANFALRSAQRGARGTLRPATTHWELIGQNYSHAYLKLRPVTGRMHQLRVHLKAIDRPIVMDPLYASAALRAAPDQLGFNRLALHALSLTFTAPSGEERRCIAPLPQQFELAAETLLADAI